ncbi:XH/XS domain-containing protein [Artemisia annua]|uniref:XH/XS domain-containing protein n=1 Tax=Artemisia annua TaxID=35608 RepID=A0A2U1P965_ARTAN|nr:XH/XS domain-containing protein [Artemisia annua]
MDVEPVIDLWNHLEVRYCWKLGGSPYLLPIYFLDIILIMRSSWVDMCMHDWCQIRSTLLYMATCCVGVVELNLTLVMIRLILVMVHVWCRIGASETLLLCYLHGFFGMVWRRAQGLLTLETFVKYMGKKGRRTTKHMSNSTNVMEIKKRPLESMESKYVETGDTIGKLIAENEKFHQSYFEDVKAMDFSIQKQLQQICNDHQLMDLELQRQEKELELRSIELEKREAANESKRKRLAKEIKESAANHSLLQSEEEMVKLADCHKREMEKLQEKISYLEKQVKDGNQNLFLEMKHLVGQLNVTEHRRDLHVKAHKKIADIHTSLKDKEEERKDLEILSQTLVSQDQKNNDELQDAQNELIKLSYEGLKEVPNTHIGVVRKLENELFYGELLRKYNETEEEKGTDSELWSSWREYLRDPTLELSELMMLAQKLEVQQAMDGKDERLKCLQRDLLGEVCKAAAEINYNTNIRYTEELWNLSESRHATLLEGVSCLLKIWKEQKRKKIVSYFEFE